MIENMPCTFKPTVDMNLNFEEAQVCAYVFNPKVDPSGNNILFGGRKQLGHATKLSVVIILFMALKVAYSQLYRTRSVWCMPPAFALDVIDGTPVETVMLHYGKDWMPSFSNLKLDIMEPRGIPNCGSSEKSALWVLEWMQMEESFVSLLYGVSIMYTIIVLIYDIKLQLDEKAVRMKVAMILLLGTHNQYKAELIRNAERTWHDSIHGKH
ncbi:hypothetical protein HKD37_17G048450 [Glycine soja]